MFQGSASVSLSSPLLPNLVKLAADNEEVEGGGQSHIDKGEGEHGPNGTLTQTDVDKTLVPERPTQKGCR